MDETKFGWIDQRYVAACLRRNPGEVRKYNIVPAVGKGDNYASTLLRVTVDLDCDKINENFEKPKQETRKFLIKCLPEGLMGTMIQEAGMWHKEMFMYKNVLPLIETYVNCRIGAKYLNNTQVSINKEIVLEDLSYKYKMADRIEQLDYEHCVIVMKKLAKFHAGSVAARSSHKEYIDTVGEELCFRESRRESNELYFRQPFKNLAEHIKDDDNLKKYSKCLKNFGEKFWDLALVAAKPKNFNVLNHGDLWTNNILFDYDSTGKVIDARLIDFQCCRYTSPAFDLQYFFMSSMQEDVRETKLHDLVNIYVTTLNSQLIKLGEKSISIEDLYNDLSITDCYGLYSSIFVLPISIRQPESIEDVDDILDTETDNMFSRCVQNKKYRNMLLKILEFYEKKGLFEEDYDNTERNLHYKGIDEEESTLSI